MGILGNILPDSTVAPAIQAQQKDLKKHMRADSLNEKIAHRPDPEQLIKDGILEGKGGSTSEEMSMWCSN